MKPRNRKSTQIVNEIRNLLEELEDHLSTPSGGGRSVSAKQKLNYSGASGGIRMLIDGGYFQEMRSLLEVTMRLRQEGFNYPKNTISMGLLRTVRGRDLVRLPAEGRKGNEKWVYAIRK